MFHEFAAWYRRWRFGEGTRIDLVLIGPPGDILRAIIASGSELGQKVQKITESGGLVSDDIVCELIAQKINSPECENGLLFDGFPRTLEQAKKITGDRLVHRSDDKPEALKKRLYEYEKNATPILHFYESQNKLIRINANKDVNQVFSDIQELIRVKLAEGR
ncbi:unnamed protein product [Schistosoma mattheei]|uniref:Uncharacterized protein n=1 Tax=Schistosoma mattheei TaxID=31246 RepID=A0A183P668_9TREM|nr:unnamed protein product [Schistosoma mattheei]